MKSIFISNVNEPVETPLLMPVMNFAKPEEETTSAKYVGQPASTGAEQPPVMPSVFK